MTNSGPPSTDTVFDELRSMVTTLLDEYGFDDAEFTPDTLFYDLGLESIDLVTLSRMVSDRYGERVNLAEFFARLDIDDVIGLRIGLLVDFMHSALSETAGRPA